MLQVLHFKAPRCLGLEGHDRRTPTLTASGVVAIDIGRSLLTFALSLEFISQAEIEGSPEITRSLTGRDFETDLVHSVHLPARVTCARVVQVNAVQRELSYEALIQKYQMLRSLPQDLPAGWKIVDWNNAVCITYGMGVCQPHACMTGVSSGSTPSQYFHPRMALCVMSTTCLLHACEHHFSMNSSMLVAASSSTHTLYRHLLRCILCKAE